MDLQTLFLKFALLGAEWVMWVLVILSVVSVTIMVERGIVFARLAVPFDGVAGALRERLRAGDLDGAIADLGKHQSVETNVAAAGLREADRGPDTAEETMIGIRKREVLGLERNLAFLGTVGSNAPFIGLFGTVLGIIKAFSSLAGSQSANFKIVMADISEALVATGVGLLVAIPAVIAYNVFNRRVRQTVTNTEALQHLVLAQLKGLPRSPGTQAEKPAKA
jgi:biopolymer transport protein ExbB